MRDTMTLTRAEAITLLRELEAYPIRCLPAVQHVQRWLAQRFADEQPTPEERAQVARVAAVFAPEREEEG